MMKDLEREMDLEMCQLYEEEMEDWNQIKNDGYWQVILKTIKYKDINFQQRAVEKEVSYFVCFPYFSKGTSSFISQRISNYFYLILSMTSW